MRDERSDSDHVPVYRIFETGKDILTKYTEADIPEERVV